MTEDTQSDKNAFFLALELVHNLKHVEIVWCSREKSFGHKFLDPVAMEFLLDEKNDCSQSEGTDCRNEKNSKAKNCTYHGLIY